MKPLPSCVLLSLGLLCLSSAAAQPMQATGLVYSITPQQVGEQSSYVVMPLPTDRLRAAMPPQALIPQAFAMLRENKATIYGNSSLRFTDQDMAARQVVIHVDPRVREYFPFVAAETVYTFTHYGMERVIFPGIADQGMTRADIPFAAFGFEVPLWQALPPQRIHAADIRLPNGERLPAAEVYARLGAQDQGLQGMVFAYLRSEQPIEVFGALRALATLAWPGREPHILPLLTHGERDVRRLALEGVRASASPSVWEAVVARLTAEQDAELHAALLAALEAAPLESVRIEALYYRAEHGEPASRVRGLQALGEMQDPRALARLRAYLAQDPPEFAMAALDVIIARGSWPVVQEILADTTVREALRQQSAAALAQRAQGGARLQGLRYRLAEFRGGAAIAELEAIAALAMDDAWASVTDALSHPDVDVQAVAARLLADRGDVGALDGIAARAARGDVSPELGRALEVAALRLMARAPDAQVERSAARDPSPFLRRVALQVLGERLQAGQGSPQALGALQSAARDAQPGIRAAAALGLRHLGTDEAFEIVLGMLEDGAEVVRADAARALGAFAGDQRVARSVPALVAFVQGGSPALQAGALEALGQLDQQNLLPLLLERAESADPQVRAAAFRGATSIGAPRQLRPVLNLVAGGLRDPHPPNRALAAELLGEFRVDLAVLALSQVVSDGDLRVRHAAIRALGRSGQRSAIGVLVGLLEDPLQEVRLAAIDNLRILNLRDAIPEIEAALTRMQDEVSIGAARQVIETLRTQGG